LSFGKPGKPATIDFRAGLDIRLDLCALKALERLSKPLVVPRGGPLDTGDTEEVMCREGDVLIGNLAISYRLSHQRGDVE
jgi:hypothetical protein